MEVDEEDEQQPSEDGQTSFFVGNEDEQTSLTGQEVLSNITMIQFCLSYAIEILSEIQTNTTCIETSWSWVVCLLFENSEHLALII